MVRTGELEGPGNSLVFNPRIELSERLRGKTSMTLPENKHPKNVNQSSLTPVEIECS